MTKSCHWSLGEGLPSNVLGGTIDVAPPVDAPLAPGDLVGGSYRVVSVLGSGASGVVYRVEQPGTGRHVALKLIGRSTESSVRQRLLREGEITARLDHPGIGRVFTAGEHEGVPFLVFELLENCRTLEEVFDALPRERSKASKAGSVTSAECIPSTTPR